MKKIFYQRFVADASFSELLHILCPEHFAQCFYGKQILVTPDLLLPLTTFIYAPTGYDAMQMRMQGKVLPPGVHIKLYIVKQKGS